MSPHERVVACSSLIRFIYVHTHTDGGRTEDSSGGQQRKKMANELTTALGVCV